MIDRRPRSFGLAVLVLLVAIAFLAIGATRSYKVYEPGMQDFGMDVFTSTSEGGLIVSSTFGGVRREGAKLFSTVDPGAPVKGRRACPT